MPATIRLYRRPSHIAIELTCRIGGLDQTTGEIVLRPGETPFAVSFSLQGDSEAHLMAMGEAIQMLQALYQAVRWWHMLPNGRDELVAWLEARQERERETTPKQVGDAASGAAAHAMATRSAARA